MEFSAPQIQFDLIVPQMIVLTTAIVLILLPLFWRSVKRELLALLAISGLVAAAVSTALQWSSPGVGFDGLLTVDPLAMAFQFLFLLGAALTVLLAHNRIEEEYAGYGDFYGLILFALLGMMAMVSTTHFLVLFLGLEILSISLYVLAGYRKMRVDSTEAALKYLLLGAFATGFFLYGVALLFGATGSLEMTQMAAAMAGREPSLLVLAGALLILVGFAFKAALAPFHMWTPDVYQGAPTPVTAFMATGTKAAAFAVLMRLTVTALPMQAIDWQTILPVLAVLTMTIGNLLAIVQNNIKRMLAYSSIAHAGYLLVALTAGNAEGQTAILYYLAVYTLMNMGAFGVLAYMGRSNRAETLSFDSYRGLGYRYPFAALAMTVFMFSLAGIPPTGGFLGKFYLFAAAIKEGFVPLVIIAVLNSVVSVYYYLRLVVNMYMREEETPIEAPKPHPALSLALVITLVGVLWLGVAPNYLRDLFSAAALIVP